MRHLTNQIESASKVGESAFYLAPPSSCRNRLERGGDHPSEAKSRSILSSFSFVINRFAYVERQTLLIRTTKEGSKGPSISSM